MCRVWGEQSSNLSPPSGKGHISPLAMVGTVREAAGGWKNSPQLESPQHVAGLQEREMQAATKPRGKLGWGWGSLYLDRIIRKPRASVPV